MLEAMKDNLGHRETDCEMIFIKHLLDAYSMQGTVLGAKIEAYLSMNKIGSCVHKFMLKYRK